MSFHRVPMLCVGAAFAFHAAAVSAQPAAFPPGLQPVSPGSFTQAPPAAACPGFSWAAKPGAVAYELAVHELEGRAQLGPTPVLRAIVPGAATSWTPSLSECLEPGASYMWFVREVGPAGDPVGGWSDGMGFTVAGSAPADLQDSKGSPKEALAVSGNGNGPASPPPTNREILTKLTEVLAILREPEPAFSFVLCTEPAFQGEVEAGSQLTLDGTIEGRVGAEGYGNGAMVRLKGAPASKLDAKLKGGWDILKFGACWDIGATVRNRRAAAAAGMPAAPFRSAAAADADLADVVAGLDTDDLRLQLQGLADKLQLDPARSIAALQGLGDMTFDGGVFAGLGQQGIFGQLARNIPLPVNVRTVLEDPSSLLDQFQQLRSQGLCNVSLPPALSGPVGQICQLIANEPFGKLLNRVDDAVATVSGVVSRIEGALPTSSDCKFFCKN